MADFNVLVAAQVAAARDFAAKMTAHANTSATWLAALVSLGVEDAQSLQHVSQRSQPVGPVASPMAPSLPFDLSEVALAHARARSELKASKAALDAASLALNNAIAAASK